MMKQTLRSLWLPLPVLLLLAGCSTGSNPSDEAYMRRAAVPVITGAAAASPEEAAERAKRQAALGVTYAAPTPGAKTQPAQPWSVARPVYPPAARAAGKEGRVLVAIVISRDGEVTAAKVIEATDPIFAEPALAAVKQWKFNPGMVNGHPVNMSSTVPVVFSLK